MTAIRCSSLPIMQYCCKAPTLDLGSGRAAAQSTAFHALCAGQDNASELLLLLSDKERAELESWKFPTPLRWNDHELHYAHASTELAVAIKRDWTTCELDDPEAMLTGHLDMLWMLPTEEWGRIAIVGDIKRSAYTAVDGPESPQLHGYGFCAAAKLNADWYVPVLWIATEGRWEVGTPVDLASMRAAKIWTKLVAITERTRDEYSTGSHCGSCWSRLRCPAHMVQLNQDAVAVPGTDQVELSEGQALQLLLDKKRHEDAVEAAEAYLKAWVDRNGAIRDGQGKEYRSIPMAGRESVMGVEKLRAALGADAEKFINKARESRQFRWVKEAKR